jgi:hypothetical protein
MPLADKNRELQQSKAMAFFIFLPFEFLDESNSLIRRRPIEWWKAREP